MGLTVRRGREILAAILICLVTNGRSRADAIDDYVKEEMARMRIPGIAIAIVEYGQLQRAQSYGYVDLEHWVPSQPDMVFESGSIGKQFTATAVMRMVEDGKLRLDEPLRTYFPAAPESWQPITVRHVLNGTSGSQEPGQDVAAHRGHAPDFSTCIIHYLRDNVTVVVFANLTEVDEHVERTARGIARLSAPRPAAAR